MIIGVPKELKSWENRVALTPDTIKELVKKGFTVHIEKDAGIGSFITDEAYQTAGATIKTKDEIYRESDTILKVNAPQPDEIRMMKRGDRKSVV